MDEIQTLRQLRFSKLMASLDAVIERQERTGTPATLDELKLARKEAAQQDRNIRDLEALLLEEQGKLVCLLGENAWDQMK